jgi:hypothetical protein
MDSGCLLNIHEDERMDSDNWIPLGWIPIIDETKSRRPTQGYQGSPARNTRLFHDSWRHFISNFCKQFSGLRVVIYADGIARETMHFIAGCLGYQQVFSSMV